jgi:hypothetical protein
MQIKPIQTRYKGYHFRSRLEARWAVFFDALALEWEYEPQGFELSSGLYLPDFKVSYPDQKNCWFECKGALEDVRSDEWARMIEFEEAAGLIVLDGVPDCRMYLSPTQICERVKGEFDEPLALVRPYSASKHIPPHNRFGWALWSYKGRPWVDEHENFFGTDYSFDMGAYDIALAVAKARSARFEHGQRGAT